MRAYSTLYRIYGNPFSSLSLIKTGSQGFPVNKKTLFLMDSAGNKKPDTHSKKLDPLDNVRAPGTRAQASSTVAFSG